MVSYNCVRGGGVVLSSDLTSFKDHTMWPAIIVSGGGGVVLSSDITSFKDHTMWPAIIVSGGGGGWFFLLI